MSFQLHILTLFIPSTISAVDRTVLTGVDVVAKTNNTVHAENQTPVFQPVATYFTDWATWLFSPFLPCVCYCCGIWSLIL